MPVVHVNMLDGRTMEQKRAMVKSITDAIVSTIDCTPDQVRIILHDIPRHNVASAGVLFSDFKNR